MTTEKTVVAEPVAMLEARIMDPTVPKNRAEHWAAREIEKLRAEVKGLTRELAEAKAEVGRLREALHRIGTGDWCIQLTSLPPICSRAYEARRVLGEKLND